MAISQMKRNKMTEWTKVIGGMDNVELPTLEEFKGCWDKILNEL